LRHSRSTTPHRQSDPPPYQQNSDTVHERSRNILPDCLSNHAGRHRRMQQPNSHKHLHYHHKQWHSRLLHVRRQLDIRHRLNIARRREQPVVEQLLKKPTWILLLVSLSLFTCYVALGYVMHSSSCTNSLGGGSYKTLNNNTIVSFLTIANMGYDYCGTYLASQTGGSTTSFSIFWTS